MGGICPGAEARAVHAARSMTSMIAGAGPKLREGRLEGAWDAEAIVGEAGIEVVPSSAMGERGVVRSGVR